MQLFFLEERVNMCESHCSLELFFLVYQKGTWWAWQRTSEGNIYIKIQKNPPKNHEFHCQDISCLSQENFKNFIKDQNTMQELHNKFLRYPDYLLHNVCPSKQLCWMCQGCDVWQSSTIIRIDVETNHRSVRASENGSLDLVKQRAIF